MEDINKSKVRIRLQTGEEFEAEGSQAFIEQQRAYFLGLIGKLQAAPKMNQPATTPTIPPAEFSTPLTNNPARVWERLLKEDGTRVYLRRKHKITPAQAACLLLAGARALLKKGELSALELSHSLKESNIILPNRLDRLLGGEIQQGYLVCEGAKRSRTYKLTDSGFAHTFVLAEKLVGEIQ